ncbi:glutaminyl-peptide cyclotransferase [Pontiella agarivorans]|uniref:Glutaminyl-peptide cyclotransferase n=1 Tax=Pontiella agarivorans TaxID=3038953 RepID=A0ABU5N144_9BACT|nr:glutaminyl-peptide cyclotransferase [Pontiella agarivorans]MDZ8120179.1 glutaminyl-peptide cyclotransferase [Pontiella agarivorans]
MNKWISGNFQTIALILIVCGMPVARGLAAEATYNILKTTDHDPTLFTQGFMVDGDELIESSGLYGQSRILRYKIATGKVIHSRDLPASVFAEGLHLLNDSVYLLTWREGCAYRLDAADFSIQQRFVLETEGWGLTHDGTHFIQSDGSNVLYFRNSSTFKVEKQRPVYNGMRRQNNLNELEYARGLIWANVYMTPTIVAISPNNGRVVFSLDLSALAARHNDGDIGHVLNGIAYDPQRDAFWITGKCWNKRYLIQINPPETAAPEK